MLEDLEGNYERSSQRCNTQGSYQGLSGSPSSSLYDNDYNKFDNQDDFDFGADSASNIYNNPPSPLAIYTTRLATRSNLYQFSIANFIAPIYNRTNEHNNDYKDNSNITTIGNSIVTKYCRYLLSSILPIIDLVLPSYLPKYLYLQVVVQYIVGTLGYTSRIRTSKAYKHYIRQYIPYQYYIKNS